MVHKRTLVNHGALALITNGTIQTIATFWFFLPIALKTEPLKNVKVLATEAIVVTPAPKVALMIVMTTEIATTLQPLITAKTKVTTLHIGTNQGPTLAILKTQDTIMTIIFMITPRERNRNTHLLISPTKDWLHKINYSCQVSSCSGPYSFQDCFPQEDPKGTVCKKSSSLAFPWLVYCWSVEHQFRSWQWRLTATTF